MFKDTFAPKLKKLDDDGIRYEVRVKSLQGDQLLKVIDSLFKSKPSETIHYEILLYKVGKNAAFMNKFGEFREYLRNETDSQFKFDIIDCLKNPEMAEKANI